MAGLQAAQRLRRISLPRRAEESKGWPLAKSEKVISGGSCTGVREGVQEVRKREVRLMRARRCRVIGKERKSTGNPRVGLGGGSTSIFEWRGEVGGWGKEELEQGACLRNRNPHFEGYEYKYFSAWADDFPGRGHDAGGLQDSEGAGGD